MVFITTNHNQTIAGDNKCSLVTSMKEATTCTKKKRSNTNNTEQLKSLKKVKQTRKRNITKARKVVNEEILSEEDEVPPLPPPLPILQLGTYQSSVTSSNCLPLVTSSYHPPVVTSSYHPSVVTSPYHPPVITNPYHPPVTSLLPTADQTLLDLPDDILIDALRSFNQPRTVLQNLEREIQEIKLRLSNLENNLFPNGVANEEKDDELESAAVQLILSDKRMGWKAALRKLLILTFGVETLGRSCAIGRKNCKSEKLNEIKLQRLKGIQLLHFKI